MILGGGGHARVVLSALRLLGADVDGFTDPDGAATLDAVPYLGTDDALSSFAPSTVYVAIGIGSTGDTGLRRRVYENAQSGQSKPYCFPPIVHPAGFVAPEAQIGRASHVMAGAIIQAGTQVGQNVLVNTNASVDHGCRIGDHSHIAPGVTISGSVTIGEGVHIGTGATVIQGVTIGDQVTVGAGAVVIQDVPPQTTVIGVPARPHLS